MPAKPSLTEGINKNQHLTEGDKNRETCRETLCEHAGGKQKIIRIVFLKYSQSCITYRLKSSH